MEAKKHLNRARIVINDKKKGCQYELGIAGYEFEEKPEEEKEGVSWDGEYDGNWLNVSFRVKDNERDDSYCNPCLLTWELEHLAGGLEYFLAHPEEKDYEPYFTENCFRIHIHRLPDGGAALRMYFTAEGTRDGEFVWKTFRYSGVFSEREIRRAVKSLKVFCSAFPYREFEDNRVVGTDWIA